MLAAAVQNLPFERVPVSTRASPVRETLLRLSLEQPFAGWDGSTATIGAGWVWLAALVGWLVLRFRAQTRSRDDEAVPLAWSVDDWFNVGLFAVAGLVAVFVLPGRGLKEISLFGYGVCVLLGFLAGTTLARRRLESIGWPGDLAFTVGFWILLSGIIGARVFWLLQHGADALEAAHQLGNASAPRFTQLPFGEQLLFLVNLPSGGLVLYGGVVAGAAAFALFCWRSHLPPLRLADVLTPSVLVGVGFGRLGCLMRGCCFGDPCSLPWAISFPPKSVPNETLALRGFLEPGQTLPLHPTQIYSSISAFLLAALTAAWFWRRRGDGEVVALGLVGYAIGRFLVEFLRGDELGQLGTSLTISQLISLGMLAAGIGLGLWTMRRTTPKPAASTPQTAGESAATPSSV